MATASKSRSLNQTSRLLLGMIAEGHATGYAIKAEIERSTRLYWGASIGGIYPELRRLVNAGLVSVRDDPRGGTRRHRYTLTDAGREALHSWLADPSEPAVEMRHEALLRLRFAGVLEPEARLRLLRDMKAVHQRQLDQLQARLATDQFDDPLHRMAFEFGLGFHEWARDWCSAAERAIAQNTLTKPARNATGSRRGAPDRTA